MFCSLTKHPEITRSMQELCDSLASDSKAADNPDIHPLCAMGKLYEIIGLLYQYCTVDFKPLQKSGKKLEEILTYINAHYTEHISSKTISQKFGYDETYFCRLFKKATGIPAMKYILILRLELAQKLLLNTGQEISQIAWQCGFSEESYFSNCFKRHFGLTPTAFRNASVAE